MSRSGLILDAPKNDGEAVADYLDKCLTSYGEVRKKAGNPCSIDSLTDGLLHIFENIVAIRPDIGDQIIDAIRRQKFKIALMRDDTKGFVQQ